MTTTARSRHAARARSRRRRSQLRVRRIAVLVFLAALAVITLLTAFGTSGTAPPPIAPAVQSAQPAGRPQPQPLATVGNLSIALPVAAGAVTAIGFHGSATGALTLQPLGQQANEGLLARLWHRIAGSAKEGAPSWFQLGGDAGPGTSVLDIGALPGTDVYSPVNGTIAAITDYIVNGERHGAQIDIRPSAAPSVVLSLTHIEPDPALAVGSSVLVGTSKLGAVINIAKVERQALASHTNDSGDNVAIEVHSAPTSLP